MERLEIIMKTRALGRLGVLMAGMALGWGGSVYAAEKPNMLALALTQEADQDQEAQEEGDEGVGDASMRDLETINARRMRFQPLNVSVYRKNRVDARVTVELVLEILEASESDDIKGRRPQLRSDFLMGLSQMSKVKFKRNRAIDPNTVKTFLQGFADRRLGEGKVEVFIIQAYTELK